VNVLDMISAIRSLNLGKSLEPMSAQEVFDCSELAMVIFIKYYEIYIVTSNK
jgi:hypothetical protein